MTMTIYLPLSHKVIIRCLLAHQSTLASILRMALHTTSPSNIKKMHTMQNVLLLLTTPLQFQSAQVVLAAHSHCKKEKTKLLSSLASKVPFKLHLQHTAKASTKSSKTAQKKQLVHTATM